MLLNNGESQSENNGSPTRGPRQYLLTVHVLQTFQNNLGS
jgi:hypothetical protein